MFVKSLKLFYNMYPSPPPPLPSPPQIKDLKIVKLGL